MSYTPNYCATDCPCRLTPRYEENPCKCGLWRAGECAYCCVTVGGVTKKHSVTKEKAEALAEFDAAMATALANVAPVNPKRKKRPVSRRTPEQMERARQREAEQEKREADYRTRMASPDWLKDQLDVEADFVASLGKDE